MESLLALVTEGRFVVQFELIADVVKAEGEHGPQDQEAEKEAEDQVAAPADSG